MRLLGAANTPKAFIGALVLFVILDGFLFYRYQLEKRDALTTLPSTRAAALGPTPPEADSEGEQEEPQREETNQRSGTSEDDERKESSDLQENTPKESSPTAKESSPRTTGEPSGVYPAAEVPAAAEGPPPPRADSILSAAEEPPPSADESPVPTTGDLP